MGAGIAMFGGQVQAETIHCYRELSHRSNCYDGNKQRQIKGTSN